MNPSYRLGLLVVVGSLVVASGVSLALVGARPARPARAALDLADHPSPLGAFRLTERSGRTVTDGDLASRVWVAAFIFTRCPSSCPRISSVMKSLQDRFQGTRVRLVSITVDPDHDSPAVLADYARRFGAEPDRWYFLTGPKSEVYGLILNRFHLGVAPAGPADQKEGAEAISHSARLALVDRGNQVVGYFDSDSREDLDQLVARARRLDRRWVRLLPTLNASLNATSAILLLLGLTMIRTGRVRAHATCMVAAVVVSSLFFVSYGIYHFQVRSVPFRGIGPIRTVYFTVLLSHTALAVSVVPLAIATLVRAARRRFAEHARLARVTLPIWLYVCITGVIVYLILYQMPVATEVAPLSVSQAEAKADQVPN